MRGGNGSSRGHDGVTNTHDRYKTRKDYEDQHHAQRMLCGTKYDAEKMQGIIGRRWHGGINLNIRSQTDLPMMSSRQVCQSQFNINTKPPNIHLSVHVYTEFHNTTSAL